MRALLKNSPPRGERRKNFNSAAIHCAVAIELRAIAGATYALVDKTYTPDAAASAVTDGLTPADLDVPYLTSFPYLGVSHSGYTPPSI